MSIDSRIEDLKAKILQRIARLATINTTGAAVAVAPSHELRRRNWTRDGDRPHVVEVGGIRFRRLLTDDHVIRVGFLILVHAFPVTDREAVHVNHAGKHVRRQRSGG